MLVSQPLPSKTGCGQAVFFIILLLQLCSRNAENEFFKLQTTEYIDNHDSGYLGMAVQLYVLAHLGHYHNYLDTKGIQPDGTTEIYAPFTYICLLW